MCSNKKMTYEDEILIEELASRYNLYEIVQELVFICRRKAALLKFADDEVSHKDNIISWHKQEEWCETLVTMLEETIHPKLG